MNNIEQVKNAKEFVERWTGRGDEKQDAQSYWRDLLVNVLGVPSSSLANFISFERKVQGGYIDAFIEDTGVLIEQKSLGVDLNRAQKQSDGTELTPYGQAMRYGAKLPFSLRPRWIITSNFERILVHDQEKDPSGKEPYEIRLADLPNELYRLSFITDKANSRLERERELSVKAGGVVGKLYASFSSQYQNIETDPAEQRSLNILIVRLVFLLYAEDAGLLQHHGALYDYLKLIPVSQMRQAIIDLFRVLDTPDGTNGTENKRDPYLAPELLEFPYVNGGLFAEEDIIVPQFTDQIRLDLLVEASSKFDWSDVSPTIFGAVFESTLNPETRRAGGMHYTSIENIHKVIDPLFLDDLKAELTEIEGIKVEKTRNLKLRQFQDKLASIRVLDPACGSGNFLTESFLSLRKLENRVLENLMGEQMGLGFAGDANPIKVSIDQFYGIEINDFAVSVAKTALWIAEEQTMDITQEILVMPLQFLPLTSNNNIVQANALRMDWKDVLPAEKCSYIIGNPPFLGAKLMSSIQKSEIVSLFAKVPLANSLDYVSGWYYKAADYIQNTSIECAFVSTNSITQGQQVYPLWHTIVTRFGIRIIFAHKTFIWDSEASQKAHVYCVIIGFSCIGRQQVMLFDGAVASCVREINPYLIAAPWVAITNRSRPICNVVDMALGNSAYDDGAYILTKEEKDSLIASDSRTSELIKPYIGAKEFINGDMRWAIWLENIDKAFYRDIAAITDRIEHVRQFRLDSTAEDTRKKAETPELFFRISQPNSNYLIVPLTSSERRTYLPIGYMSPDTIVAKSISFIADADLYTFGVMSSQFHNAWMRTVAGRLKSDYRYSNKIVYNNFIWPDPIPEQKQAIEQTAQTVLDTRDAHPDWSLAQLYDPDRMPSDLLEAHKALDRAVEYAYGVNFNGDEKKIVAHLFNLYAIATEI